MFFFVLNDDLEKVGEFAEYDRARTCAVSLACGAANGSTYRVASRLDDGQEWATDVPLRWHLSVYAGEQP